MKILYAIQGTGNGHLTRAMEIVPALKNIAETDVLISGIQSDLELPFKLKYQFKGLSFIFGKEGGVDIWKTYLMINSLRLLQDIKKLKVDKYDLIISDFEPVSAWACQLAGIPCVGLSNQIATLHPKAPKPKSNDKFGKFILKHYAPTSVGYGYHFKSLDSNVYTPLIRKEVREAKISSSNHYTVYLPSYDEKKIVKRLRQYKGLNWQVFSKHTNKYFKEDNFEIFPLNTEKFLKSMASSKGVLCNAGFGTTSEALFLGKKLLVIPMKTQYEQHCNAEMLKSMGVDVVKKLKNKYQDKIADWLETAKSVSVDYPENTTSIVETIVNRHAGVHSFEDVAKVRYPIFQ